MYNIKNNSLILFIIALLTSIPFISDNCYSQVNPSLQINFGLTFPGKDFGGELVTTNDSGYTYISPDFIANNYAASTGVNVTGTIKFPLGPKGNFSFLFLGSYSYFNLFKRSILGTSKQNNLDVAINFDNKFTTTTIGLGLEATPFHASKISPFVNASLTVNILSLTLQQNNFITTLFNDAFRMGVLTNAGVTVRLGGEYSLVIGGSYHMSNLLFKSQSSDYNDRIVFERENLPINDKGGTYYTNLSDPNFAPSLVNGKTKNVNWWGFNIGINIVLGKSNKK